MEKSGNRADKLKTWAKERHNFIFLLILAFAIVVRLYYFSLTSGQPLWWDEADYLAYAKNLAGIQTHWIVTPQHNSLFPFIAAIFFKIGFSEAIVKFFVEIIPSIAVVLLTYLIAGELYKDKRIALIASFLIAVFWELLFNSMRFHLEALALMTAFLAVYIFFKGYEKKEKVLGIKAEWAMSAVVLLVVLTYGIRRGFFLFGAFFALHLLLTKKISVLIKDKNNWIALVFGLIIFFLMEKFIFVAPITEVAGSYSHSSIPFSLLPLKVFGMFYNNMLGGLDILTYLFWTGLAAVIGNLFLHFGYLKNEESKDARGDFFILIMILTTLAYFLFYQRLDPSFEPRWFYPLLLGSSICIAKSTLLIADFSKQYHKALAILIIVLLIGYGGYYELKEADSIIKNKVNTFQGVRDAGYYIKEISSPDDIILSIPEPQLAYYAERKVINPFKYYNKHALNTTLEDGFNIIRKENVKFLIVTLSEPNHPLWMRQDIYYQDPNTGQVSLAGFTIPFMNTTLDFANQKQDIKQEMDYSDIKFKLLTIKEDAFVYGVNRA